MDINFVFAIIAVFISLLLIIFCSFFSARLAQLKNRSKVWGFLGFFLGIIGLIIVCYLPSKRKDDMQTNPITHAINKMPSMSRKTIGFIVGIVILVALTVVAYDNIPKLIENHKYTKEMTEYSEVIQDQPKLINAVVKEIFTGNNSTYMISENNDLYCWGKQFSNQLENEQRGIIYKNVKKADSNDEACFVLTQTGELFGIGSKDSILLPYEKDENAEKTETIEEFIQITDNVTDFTVSETTVGIIKNNGDLYMYGDNSYGQLGTNDTEAKDKPVLILEDIIQVVCESTYTVALDKSGDVYAFGTNIYGQFGKEEKQVYSHTKIQSNVKAISAGDDFIILLKNNGEVVACGNNTNGQLGNATNESAAEFVSVLSGIKAIDSAKKSVIALAENGDLYAWGQNNVGQLGCGNEIDLNTPTVVASEITTAATDGLHTVAITTKNNIIATGLNTYGQSGKAESGNTFSEMVSIK